MKKNKGFALVVSLFVVFLISMMGAVSLQSSFIQQNVAMNTMAAHKSYQAAESAIKYFMDRIYIQGFVAADILAEVEAGTVFHCIDQAGVFTGQANCANRFIDSGNSIRSIGFMAVNTTEPCLAWGNSGHKITCYNILGSGIVDGLNSEANHLQQFRVIEVDAAEGGVFEF